MRNLLGVLYIFPPLAVLSLAGCSSLTQQNDKSAYNMCPPNSKTCPVRSAPTKQRQVVYRQSDNKTQYLDHTVSWIGTQRSGAAYNKAGFRHVVDYSNISEGPVSSFNPSVRSSIQRPTVRKYIPSGNKPITNKRAPSLQNVRAKYQQSRKDYVLNYQSKAKPKFNKSIPREYIALYEKYCAGKSLTSKEQNTIHIMGGIIGVPPSLAKSCKP